MVPYTFYATACTFFFFGFYANGFSSTVIVCIWPRVGNLYSISSGASSFSFFFFVALLSLFSVSYLERADPRGR